MWQGGLHETHSRCLFRLFNGGRALDARPSLFFEQPACFRQWRHPWQRRSVQPGRNQREPVRRVVLAARAAAGHPARAGLVRAAPRRAAEPVPAACPARAEQPPAAAPRRPEPAARAPRADAPAPTAAAWAAVRRARQEPAEPRRAAAARGQPAPAAPPGAAPQGAGGGASGGGSGGAGGAGAGGSTGTDAVKSAGCGKARTLQNGTLAPEAWKLITQF
jgi:hypothetical protein